MKKMFEEKFEELCIRRNIVKEDRNRLWKIMALYYDIWIKKVKKEKMNVFASGMIAIIETFYELIEQTNG